MIRHIAIAGFALVVATSAQAMTPAPLLQPDSLITKVVAGCGIGKTMVNVQMRDENGKAPREAPDAADRSTGYASCKPDAIVVSLLVTTIRLV